MTYNPLKTFRKLKPHRKWTARGLCFVFLACFPALFVGMALLISAGPNRRGNFLERYNAAVDFWLNHPAGYRAYQDQSFALRSVPAQTTLATLSMARAPLAASGDVATSLKFMPVASDIALYPTQHYRYAGFVTRNTPFPDYPGFDWGLTRVHFQLLNTTGMYAAPLWNESIAVTWKHSYQENEWGECAPYATNTNGTCTTVYVLKAVCFIVDPWNGMQPDYSDGEGCGVLDPMTRLQPPELTGATAASGGYLSKAAYAPFPSAAVPAGGWLWNIQGVSFTFRSKWDPLVSALKLSNGSMEVPQSNRLKTYGSIGMIVGAVLCGGGSWMWAKRKLDKVVKRKMMRAEAVLSKRRLMVQTANAAAGVIGAAAGTGVAGGDKAPPSSFSTPHSSDISIPISGVNPLAVKRTQGSSSSGAAKASGEAVAPPDPSPSPPRSSASSSSEGAGVAINPLAAQRPRPTVVVGARVGPRRARRPTGSGAGSVPVRTGYSSEDTDKSDSSGQEPSSPKTSTSDASDEKGSGPPP